jgi:Family of unknown function (DUF6328)
VNTTRSGVPESEARDPDEIDDQFRALLEGLRTTIPGVMVQFTFLLILPFQASFAELSGVDRLVYYVAFASSALAAVLLIAPSVHQRVRAPISGIKRRSMQHVMVATKLALVGTVMFVVAIAAVVYLVSSIVFDSMEAAVATIVVTGVAVWAWFYLPLVTFRGDGEA